MTDRDVIWVYEDEHLYPQCRWMKSHVPTKSRRDAEPHIPLARAQNLQRALTSVAEGLEDYRDAKMSGDRAAPDPLDFIAETAASVRRILNRFERPEQGEDS